MQNDITERPRPRIRAIEILIIALFLFALFITRIGYPGRSIITSINTFIILFSGYFIFLPPKQLRGGITISIINGVALGLLYYLASLYCFSTFLIWSEVLIVFMYFLAVIIVLIVVLLLLNKPFANHTWYLREVVIRNTVLLPLFIILIVLSDKTRVLLFMGSDSESYCEILQDEYLGAAYSLLDEGKQSEALDRAKYSVYYSARTRDKNFNLYLASLNVLGYCYYKDRQYLLADSILNLALRKSTFSEVDVSYQYHKTIRYLAFNYSDLGNYKKSDSLCLSEISADKNEERQLYIIETLAYNAKMQNRFTAADSLYRICLKTCLNLNIPNPGYYIELHNNLASNCVEANNFTEADSLYKVALNLTFKYFADTNKQLLSNIYKVQSDLYYRLARYKQARDLCSRSLGLQSELTGPESSMYLMRLAALTQIKMALSDYSDAERTLKGILATNHALNRSTTPQTGAVCFMLANLYCDYASYSEALKYALQSLDIDKKNYGEEAVETCASMDKLAYANYCAGNHKIADSLYRYALALKNYYKETPDQSYAASLNGLGLVYIATNQTGKADTVLNYAKTIIKNILGTEHPEYAVALNNQGYLRLKQDSLTDAEECFAQALRINEGNFGNQHKNICDNLIGLATVKTKQGARQEAITICQRTIAIYKTIFAFPHPNIEALEEEIKLLGAAPLMRQKNKKRSS